jgi:hypothetical protein
MTFIYYYVSVLATWGTCVPCDIKNRNIMLCVLRMKNQLLLFLNEDLDIDSDDHMDLENV